MAPAGGEERQRRAAGRSRVAGRSVLASSKAFTAIAAMREAMRAVT